MKSILPIFVMVASLFAGCAQPAPVQPAPPPAPPPCYSLSVYVSPQGSGSVTVLPPPDVDGKYAAGSKVLLTANANPGFKLDKWEGDVSQKAAESPITEAIDRNKAIFAIFSPVPIPTSPPITTPALSEQPDKATFAQYFSKLSLGRLPPEWVGSTDWPWHIVETNVFSTGDTIATMGEVIKEVAFSTRYYDTSAKKFVGGSPMGPPSLKPGGFAGTSRLDVPPGKYEQKCYVGEILVAVLPFEVK